MLKSAPFSVISTAIFIALTLIALRVLCNEQYTKSGIITLHINFTDALFNQPTSPPPTPAPHPPRVPRDPGLLHDFQDGASSALSAAATGIADVVASDASLDDSLNTRRHGVVYSTNVEKGPQLARPAGFPINANGLIKSGDPWQDFEESHRLRFGLDHRVTVAERKTSPYDIVAIRSFSGDMENAQVRILQSIQHHNFARTLDVFRAVDSTYVVFEHAHVSLHEISRSRAKITKTELAAILGQLVNGLSYLSIQGLEHGSLSRSNILVTIDGVVKIGAFEGCCTRVSDATESPDLKALGRIAMEVMQGGQTEDMDIIGVRDLSTWDSEAASFLAETTSATSPDELKKHPLLQLPWKAHHLRRQVAITMLTVRIGLSL
ncbi:hypothetical protein E8E12_000150 [Didymella heteroderae]|uniref:Protein kinase domain-containing protein n=1 Tax=Didymella heteroderae TaxID=1769908 RepID=A0A9P5BUV5_9PLEO|nr:hypothetical protein E8E12_000150 [Didymella heteroderae]